jgi:phosphate transport system substrate-binding protein
MQVVSVVRSLMVPFVVIALGFRALGVQAAEPSSIVRIVGSTTVEKSILEPNRDGIRAATGIALEFKCQGSGAGLLELAKGAADASGSSESLPQTIASANKRAIFVQDATKLPKNLVFTKLGHDRIVVIVNAKNTAITKLSKKQLAAIYTQKIINWKELGGNDEPILVLTGPVGSATRSEFQKVIMDGAEYPVKMERKGAMVMTSDTTATEYAGVALKANAIAAVSESSAHKSKDIRIVETPIIDRPLGLITVGRPSANVQKVIDYLRSKESGK